MARRIDLKKITSPAQALPASKAEAKFQGASAYYTGKPCKRGHLSPRYPAGHCVACVSEYAARWYKENIHRPEIKARIDKHNKIKVDRLKTDLAACMEHYGYMKEWRDKNPEKVKLKNARARKKTLAYMKEYLVVYNKINREQLDAKAHNRNIKNSARNLARTKKWALENPDKANANSLSTAATRRAAKQNACPRWANKKAIKAVFAERRHIQNETGIRMAVDHIVPLRNKRVCGLHIEMNLRIISHEDNRHKGNYFDESIAIAPTIANGLLNK